MTTCIVSVLAFVYSFNNINLPISRNTGAGKSWTQSSILYYGKDDLRNSWEFVNEKGQRVTFIPECKETK